MELDRRIMRDYARVRCQEIKAKHLRALPSVGSSARVCVCVCEERAVWIFASRRSRLCPSVRPLHGLRAWAQSVVSMYCTSTAAMMIAIVFISHVKKRGASMVVVVVVEVVVLALAVRLSNVSKEGKYLELGPFDTRPFGESRVLAVLLAGVLVAARPPFHIQDSSNHDCCGASIWAWPHSNST